MAFRGWYFCSVDPRYFQIISLIILYVFSLLLYDFALNLAAVPFALAGTLLAQFIGSRLARIPFDGRSAVITALSIALLLRAQRPEWFMVCGIIAISSKLVVRWRGKHIFNPSNIAIVLLLLLKAPVWVSPGQWGQVGWIAGLAIVLAALVLGRTRRVDTAMAFLAADAVALGLRAAWLGDPLSIPMHQIQTVSVLVFAGFMITDPRATPDHHAARIGFAVAVAALALALQIKYQLVGAPIYALAVLSPIIPLLDGLVPASRFTWRTNKEG